MIKVEEEIVTTAIELLEKKGIFTELDIVGPSLSTPQGAKSWEFAIEESGYDGDLVVEAIEDSGNWLYYLYDLSRIDPGKARVAAGKAAAAFRFRL